MFTYCHYQSYNHVQSCLKKDLFLTERVTSDCTEHVAPMDAAAVWDVHGVYVVGLGGHLEKALHHWMHILWYLSVQAQGQVGSWTNMYTQLLFDPKFLPFSTVLYLLKCENASFGLLHAPHEF